MGETAMASSETFVTTGLAVVMMVTSMGEYAVWSPSHAPSPAGRLYKYPSHHLSLASRSHVSQLCCGPPHAADIRHPTQTRRVSARITASTACAA